MFTFLIILAAILIVYYYSIMWDFRLEDVKIYLDLKQQNSTGNFSVCTAAVKIVLQVYGQLYTL